MRSLERDGASVSVECQVVHEPEVGGAPLERGSSFVLAAPVPSAVSIWAAPLGRVALMGAALLAVALLGHAAEDASRHGVALAPDAGRAQVSLVSPSQNAERASGPAQPPHPAGDVQGSSTPTDSACSCPAPPPCAGSGARPSAAPHAAALTAEGKVILNEASLDDFMRLPGVGEKRAQALLALREKLGRFKKFNDLLRVKGIGHKTVKKFAELAVLDRPPPAPAETGSGPSLSVPAAPKVAAPATEPAH